MTKTSITTISIHTTRISTCRGGVEGSGEGFFVVDNDEDTTADETGSETVATFVSPNLVTNALTSRGEGENDIEHMLTWLRIEEERGVR